MLHEGCSTHIAVAKVLGCLSMTWSSIVYGMSSTDTHTVGWRISSPAALSKIVTGETFWKSLYLEWSPHLRGPLGADNWDARREANVLLDVHTYSNYDPHSICNYRGELSIGNNSSNTYQTSHLAVLSPWSFSCRLALNPTVHILVVYLVYTSFTFMRQYSELKSSFVESCTGSRWTILAS